MIEQVSEMSPSKSHCHFVRSVILFIYRSFWYYSRIFKNKLFRDGYGFRFGAGVTKGQETTEPSCFIAAKPN